MIHADEIEMMRRVLAHPEGLFRGEHGGLVEITKREGYVLSKWTDRDWWDYGVSLRAGWLTDKGRTAFERRLAEPAPFSRAKRIDDAWCARTGTSVYAPTRLRPEPAPSGHDANMRAIAGILAALAEPRSEAEQMAALASVHRRLSEAIRWLRGTRGRVVRCREERRRMRVLRAMVADRYHALHRSTDAQVHRAARRIEQDWVGGAPTSPLFEIDASTDLGGVRYGTAVLTAEMIANVWRR